MSETAAAAAAAAAPVPASSDVEALTSEQREEIHQAFSFYDRDGDEKIKPSELGIVIRSLGHGLCTLLPHHVHAHAHTHRERTASHAPQEQRRRRAR